MLDFAISYEDKLKEKFLGIMYNEKYKFYNDSSYYNVFEVNKKDIGWSNIQMVSKSSDGEILGYIKVSICQDSNMYHGLVAINFSDNVFTFGKDLMSFMHKLFERPDMRKLNFGVVIGNPIESTYDKLIDKYGGRIVGTKYKQCKLFDGKYYDYKMYEIFREDYLSKR